MSVLFFPGLHQTSDAKHFQRCCIAVHRFRNRRAPMGCPEVFIDSGAFTTIARFGGYPDPVFLYARRLHEIHHKGIASITAAVAQDYMCEAFMLKRTGMTVRQHQELTIERYDELLDELTFLFEDDVPFPVIPVLQGYQPGEYQQHLDMYGDRLKPGMWVGVGSVCKRNSSTSDVIGVLDAIERRRPGLRLHGFGLKTTALKDTTVRSLLYSADSMGWALHEQKELTVRWSRLCAELGRKLTTWEVKQILRNLGQHCPDPNSWRAALRFSESIERQVSTTETSWQMGLPLHAAE
jgi:hypothetical protein